MNYEEFLRSFYANYLPNQTKQIRQGQALFNYLAQENPICAEKLRGREEDCFYSDFRIGKALIFIQENW
jgi:hypothetical protein